MDKCDLEDVHFSFVISVSVDLVGLDDISCASYLVIDYFSYSVIEKIIVGVISLISVIIYYQFYASYQFSCTIVISDSISLVFRCQLLVTSYQLSDISF